MYHIRRLFTPLFAVTLSVSSCSLADRSPEAPIGATPVASATLPAPTATPPAAPGDDSLAPTCFSPYELLPFAFTPDTPRIVVRWRQGVQFFDLATGRELTSLSAPHNVISATLSPDGASLAWSLDDNGIQIVRVSDGEILHTLTGHPDPVFDLRFSPTGSQLFSASHDGTVRVWDADEGTSYPPIAIGLEVVGIGVSPDGDTLGIVPSDGPVQLWDIATAEQIGTLGGPGGYDTSDPVFSPDGRYLAVDLATGIFIWTLPEGGEIWSGVANSMAVAYSPNGSYMAYTDVDESNKIFLGPADAQGVFSVIDEMRGPVWELFFSPDSSLLAATDGIAIRVWAVPEGKQILVGIPTCPEGPSSGQPPLAVIRQFDPSADYIADVPYPEELLSIRDGELVSLACTPEYFSWSGTDHEFFDPVTRESRTPTDPRIETYVEAARQINPGKSILSISLCESDENGPLVFYRVGPCGGGCAGIPNIARGFQDGTLAVLATVEADGDGPYFACHPLQLSKRGEMYLSCQGEGTALIRRVQIDTGVISVVLRCDLKSTPPACLGE
jgi:WD40 repeat protein